MFHGPCKCPKELVFSVATFCVRPFQKGVQFAWAKSEAYLRQCPMRCQCPLSYPA